MATKSLDLIIPDVRPYDDADTWFETFLGTHLRPVIESVPLSRFWFTRYGRVGATKSILFRFECDDLSPVQPHVDQLMQLFPPGATGYTDYDFPSDIGEGEGSRFLGQNGAHRDKVRRGNLAFDFLHSAARLFLDGLTGPDALGYFKREPETTSGFNIETSLEQFHHLFCNMTGVPTFVVEASHPQHGTHLFSLFTFSMLQQQDGRWQNRRAAKVSF